MSKLYDYILDLKEQREDLIRQVAMAELGLIVPAEIGSDAGTNLEAITEVISDLDEAIAQIEGHAWNT